MIAAQSKRLLLYVAGQSPRSTKARANLKHLCDELLDRTYAVEVIDLLLHPHRARSDEILAVPTLVLQLPTQSTRVIGDVSEAQKVFAGLLLPPAPTT